MDKQRISNLLKTLGPGILFASTCIGVSHLVQSTRAGAAFGFALVPFVIAANVFKYPFFEFGSRYANATGESIIDGYKRLGKWMLWSYFILTIGTMFFVSAAVGAVTSGFMQNLFGLTDYGLMVTIILFLGCAIILMLGKYGVLDSLVKIIGAVLLLSSLLAFVLALIQGPEAKHAVEQPEVWSDASIPFIIALMGWMPTAVDLSAWNSLWTVERMKQTGYHPTLKETLLDFNFGYIVSAVLSLCFLTLGAYMLFGTDNNSLPEGAGPFASAVIGMFTNFIGDWSYLIIAAASFSIMFGTAIAVFDGYGRSLSRTWALIKSDKVGQEVQSSSSIYSWGIAVVVAGSFAIVYFLSKNLKDLVDIATTLSFLIAPLIAIVNYKLVTGLLVPASYHPKKWLKYLSWAGIIFLTGFAVYYLWLLVNSWL
ncbi:divalent metal cation transporter [Crocinitomicaceae bacterium]|nr:divalent metal cation transporter [Crocinitomicaceae bacterium]MDB3906677.1 divalent metal cation transporter [Crocinitomicaceae bacterium]